MDENRLMISDSNLINGSCRAARGSSFVLVAATVDLVPAYPIAVLCHPPLSLSYHTASFVYYIPDDTGASRLTRPQGKPSISVHHPSKSIPFHRHPSSERGYVSTPHQINLISSSPSRVKVQLQQAAGWQRLDGVAWQFDSSEHLLFRGNGVQNTRLSKIR